MEVDVSEHIKQDENPDNVVSIPRSQWTMETISLQPAENEPILLLKTRKTDRSQKQSSVITGKTQQSLGFPVTLAV